MSIRLPLYKALSSTNNDEVGAGSVNGVVAIPFNIPQDTDNVAVSLAVTSAGGGFSAQLQTTNDGGTTWFGVARTSIVSASTGDKLEWLSVPTIGYGVRSSSIVAVGSVVSGATVGNAAPSTLGSGQSSGLPLLSQRARIALQMQAGITSSSVATTVYVNNQSNRA